jgi:hypothetical protein
MDEICTLKNPDDARHAQDDSDNGSSPHVQLLFSYSMLLITAHQIFDVNARY